MAAAAAAKSLQSRLTCCDPLDCSPPGSSVHGRMQEYWSGLLFPSPGDLLNPGIEPGPPAFQVHSLPLSHQVFAGQKVCSGFCIRCYRKTPTNFFGQPCIYSIIFTSSLKINKEISIERHELVFSMNK